MAPSGLYARLCHAFLVRFGIIKPLRENVVESLVENLAFCASAVKIWHDSSKTQTSWHNCNECAFRQSFRLTMTAWYDLVMIVVLSREYT